MSEKAKWYEPPKCIKIGGSCAELEAKISELTRQRDTQAYEIDLLRRERCAIRYYAVNVRKVGISSALASIGKLVEK